MKVYSATTEINASPEKVWNILTDAEKYPEWDPGMVRLEGKIAQGEKITAHTKASSRAFPVTVSDFEPNRKMVWSSGMPLGLFKGTRTFSLEPQGNGTVTFKVEEVFTGVLLPLIGRSLPDLNLVFADFAKGLKEQAEKSS